MPTFWFRFIVILNILLSMRYEGLFMHLCLDLFMWSQDISWKDSTLLRKVVVPSDWKATEQPGISRDVSALKFYRLGAMPIFSNLCFVVNVPLFIMTKDAFCYHFY